MTAMGGQVCRGDDMTDSMGVSTAAGGPVDAFLNVARKADTMIAALANLIGIRVKNSAVRYLLLFFAFSLLLFPAIANLEPVAPYLRAFVSAGWPSIDWLFDPRVPTISLTAAILLIVAINRAWAHNENCRARIFAQTEDIKADDISDLRDEGIITAILLLPIFPFWLMYANDAACDVYGQAGCPFTVSSSADGLPYSFAYLGAWGQLALDAYARALLFFDFSEVYGVKMFEDISPASMLGSHLIMAVRITIDLFLISGVMQLLKIRQVGTSAVLALKNSSDPARLVGSRIIGRLIGVLKSTPTIDDKKSSNNEEKKVTNNNEEKKVTNAIEAVRGIGNPEALRGLIGVLKHKKERVKGRAVAAIAALGEELPKSNALRKRAIRALEDAREMAVRNDKKDVPRKIDEAFTRLNHRI